MPALKGLQVLSARLFTNGNRQFESPLARLETLKAPQNKRLQRFESVPRAMLKTR